MRRRSTKARRRPSCSRVLRLIYGSTSPAAFEALPPHYRDVALMRDVKEMTIEMKSAEALGATRQTVKARLHRARALMREYLTR